MAERCNQPARWVAPGTGYRVCGACRLLEDLTAAETVAWFEGPSGPCDRPTDGLGAMSWPRRLAARQAK